jgi:hypothetical protein
MKANLSRQIMKQTMSGLLVFWLSGLMFLFCCDMPNVQAAETDSCPLAKANECNKEKSKENLSQFASFQRERQALDCCRMMPSIFDKARKVEKNPQTSEIASTFKISLPTFSIAVSSLDAPELYHPPVLNRGGTYLKNRVFRI